MKKRFFRDTDSIVSKIVVKCPDKEEMFEVRALWDTGASHCAVREDLAIDLGCECSNEKVQLFSSEGSKKSAVLNLAIRIPEVFEEFESVSVSTFPHGRSDIGFIIGLDIISRGKLILAAEGDYLDFSFEIGSES